MSTHKHVSTPWILLALCTGVILFSVMIIGSELKKDTTTEGISVLPDRFRQIEAEELSTPLNTRYESLGPDNYCLNDIQLGANSKMAEWDVLRTFLESHFYDAAGDFELQVRNTFTENTDAIVLSTCYFPEELYVLQQVGEGEEFAGYEVFAINGNKRIEPLAEFINPLGRVLTMRTDLFKEDILGISSRTGNASHAAWYYFKLNPIDDSFEQVESCERWFGDSFSPYGDEPTLNCEYVYQF